MNWQSLLEADARWSTRLRVAERPGRLRTLAAALAHSGDSWFWLMGLALTWWWGNPHWKALALRLIVAIIILALFVFILKISIRRQRPVGEWGAIYRINDPHSFPSGHAARSALLAMLIITWGPLWLGILALLWAPLVSLARVIMGLHYLSDVVAGASIGLIAGLLGVLLF